MNTSESILRELCNVPEKVKNVCLWYGDIIQIFEFIKLKKK